MTTITKNVIILILTVLLGTFSAAVSAQDNVHELFRQADYDMHHNRSEERLGTVYVYKRTWDVRKNKDGSYTYSNYYKGNQGDPWELSQVVNAEANKKYLRDRVTVSRSSITIYSERRYIKPSDFYQTGEHKDPMMDGTMKVPNDPFKHKKTNAYTARVTIDGTAYATSVKYSCSHERIVLYRGTEIDGMGVGVNLYTGRRVMDYFPDHMFRHKTTRVYSLNDLAKKTGMSKLDLVAYLIEHNNDQCIPEVSDGLQRSGFTYCAYKVFELDKHKEHLAALAANRRREQARLDSIECVRKQEAAARAEEEFVMSLSPEKKEAYLASTNEGMKWVDLGIGVRWGSMNVGAKKPDESGDFYCWGNSTPNKRKLMKGLKHVWRLPEYADPAVAKWGKGPHVPTTEQWSNLLSNCKFTLSDDKQGYWVTGPNGNSIYLPIKTSPSDFQNYWTDSRKSRYSALSFSTNSLSLKEINLEYLLLVRPVFE